MPWFRPLEGARPEPPLRISAMSRLQKIIHEVRQARTLIAFMGLRSLGEVLTTVGPLVVASRLSPETFGRYTLAKMAMFLFLALLVTPSQTPFIVLASQEKQRDGTMNKTFSVQLTFFAAALVIFAVLIAALSGPILAFAEVSRGVLLFVAGGFIGMAFKTFLSSTLLATDRRLTSSLAEMVFGVSNFLGIIVLSLAGWITLETVFATYLFASVVTVALFAGAVDFRVFRPFVLDKACVREMLAFTRWVFLGVTSVYFVNWGDNLVLRYYVSMQDIGVYNLAYQLFKGVVMLVFTLNAYFLPFVSRHIDDTEKIRRYLGEKRRKVVVAGLVSLLALFLVGPTLITYAFGESYRGSTAVFRILLVGSVFILYSVFYYPILNALKAYKVAQTVNLVQVVLNLLLDVMLVPFMGLTGAATATAIAYFGQAVLFETYLRRRLKTMLQAGQAGCRDAAKAL